MSITTVKIAAGSMVYRDSYRSYHALDMTDFHYQRINHSKRFAYGQHHINGIENFWR